MIRFDEYGNYYNADGEPEEDEEGYEKKGTIPHYSKGINIS